MDVRIRAFDHSPVGNDPHYRKEILGSIPSTPKRLRNAFAARWQLLRNTPLTGHHSRFITLFFKGTYSLLGFYELMRVHIAGGKHFLRYVQGKLSLFSWFYQPDQLVVQEGVKKAHYHLLLGLSDPGKPPLILGNK